MGNPAWKKAENKILPGKTGWKSVKKYAIIVYRIPGMVLKGRIMLKKKKSPVILIPLILIFLIIIFTGQAAETNRQYVLDLLYQYSPDGYYIVDTYRDEVENGTDFMEYFDGSTQALRMDSFNVIVHEISHGYTGEIAGYSSVYIFISPDESIEVPLTDIFPSRKMAQAFSKNLRTFRFDYIDTGSRDLGTQLQGVYGLLDEFNAYYLGTKTSYELLPYYLDQGVNADWGIFFNTVNGTLYGILEFKLYILKYLIFARENYAQIYSGIMANGKFRESFIKADRNAYLFILDYFSRKRSIYDHIQQFGYTVSETEEAIIFETEDMITGYGNFMDIYNLLANELSKTIYSDLMKELNNGGGVPLYPVVDLDKNSGMTLTDADEITVVQHEHEYIVNAEKDKNADSDKAVTGKNTSGRAKPAEHTSLAGEPPRDRGKTAGFPVKTMSFQDRTGDVENKLVDLTSAEVEFFDGWAVFSVVYAAFPDKIMLNSPDLHNENLEYSWSVEIDIEGDGTDDYSVSIDWFKPQGSSPFEAPVMEYVQKGVWKIRADIVELTDIPVEVDKQGNTLIFKLDLTSGPPFSRLSERSKLSFSGYYNNGKHVDWDTLE